MYKRRVGMLAGGGVRLPDGAACPTRTPACARFPLSDPGAAGRGAHAARHRQIAREIDAVQRRAMRNAAALHVHRVRARGVRAGPGASDADGLRVTFDSGVAYRDVLAGERGAGMHLRARFWRLGEARHGGEDRRPAYPSVAGSRRFGGCQAYPSSFSEVPGARLPGRGGCEGQ